MVLGRVVMIGVDMVGVDMVVGGVDGGIYGWCGCDGKEGM